MAQLVGAVLHPKSMENEFASCDKWPGKVKSRGGGEFIQAGAFIQQNTVCPFISNMHYWNCHFEGKFNLQSASLYYMLNHPLTCASAAKADAHFSGWFNSQ